MSINYGKNHWTQQYVRIMVLFLENHYGSRTAVLGETGISLGLLSRTAGGDAYHISINTMARLEEAVAKVLEEIDNDKKANKNGASEGGGGKALDDFPRPPYGILREGPEVV